MTIEAGVAGADEMRRAVSPTGALRAVCRSSLWRHRFVRTAPVLAVIAGALAVVLAGAGMTGPVPPLALISLALFAVPASGAARVGRVIEAWLDILGQAFDATTEAQLVAAREGHIVQTNIAFERLFPGGGEAVLDYVDQAGEGLARIAFRTLCERAAAGIHANAAIPLQLADRGPPRRFEISVEPATARSRYCLWRFRDIGEHRPPQPTPDEPSAVLADLLDQASTGFYSLDSEGRFVAVNRTLARWLGRGASEIVESGARLQDFLAAAPPPEAAPWDAVGKTGEAGRAAFRTARSDIFDVWVAQHPGGSGTEFRVHAMLCRGSLQGAADLAVRQADEPHLRFFANAPIAIAVVDRGGRFIKVNRALGILFETVPEMLIGRRLIDCLRPDDRQAVAAMLAGAADRREECPPVEIRLEPPREQTVILLGRHDPPEAKSTVIIGRRSPVAAAPGTIISGSSEDQDDCLTLYFIDVTQQKQLESQVAQSQKMLAIGQLAGGIAHDFNNLLTAMIGFCDLLLLRSRPGDPVFSDIMQIKQNANRAANLVRQLLTFSRLQRPQPRALDVADVLVELSDLLRRLIGEDIALEFAHGPDLGPVKADQGQLEQVIINLVVNARDAMPDGGRLTIRTENSSSALAARRGHQMMPAGDYVLIEVADTGIGIAPDNLARIFNPFFSTKAAGAGTGLGLSTVYGIVKQAGGFIFVDSLPGRGTTFAIYLPHHQAASDATATRLDTAEPAAPRDLTGTDAIMLVEDDDAVRRFGARALRNKGYQVVEASSGAAALELIRNATAPIDLLITDLVMPQLDGPSLIRAVRQVDPDIKVICISGYTEEALCQRFGGDRDIHFLSKPFSLMQLAVRVKDVLRSDVARSRFSDCTIEQNEYSLASASRP